MAFYADVYGFIAVDDEGGIPVDLLENAYRDSKGLKPSFAQAAATRSGFYISFASSVKLDEGEDDLWLLPFEALLKEMHFLRATVNFLHEESDHALMYTYINNKGIQKICSKLSEEFVQEGVIS
jgi:hypothetical protein